MLNNTYPTKNNPKQGGYVKSIVGCLTAGNIEVEVIYPKRDKESLFCTILSYISFYLTILFINTRLYRYIYIHHFPYVFLPLIFRLNKKNTVIHFHGGDIMPISRLQKILNKISYLFLKPDYTYIVPSEYFKNQVKKKIPKLICSRIIVSPSGGVDINQFKRDVKNGKRKTLVIGFASGLNYFKGADDLVTLIEHFKKSCIQFAVIDYGRDKLKYHPILKTFENVYLKPTFEKSRMYQFYSNIDILFFPTKGESLGLVALEAMSCGTPVVGPNDFALKEIIINGVNGEKYNPDVKEDYVRAVKIIINNIDSYETRTSVVEKYSKQLVVEQYKEIFN